MSANGEAIEPLLSVPGSFCYRWIRMTRETTALLEAFEHLPIGEKRAFTEEVLRRLLPFDSGPLENEEIGTVSSALFQLLDGQDENTTSR
jgi:hypothetical protein